LLVEEHQIACSAAELDLLARIAAREGRFHKARQRWEAALHLEPDNETFRACLRGLTVARRFRLWLRNLLNVLFGLLVLSALVVGIGALLFVFAFK
jgi:hypothetical protein